MPLRGDRSGSLTGCSRLCARCGDAAAHAAALDPARAAPPRAGSSARLRKGNIQYSELAAKGFDTDNVFMLCELEKDTMKFQVISKTGKTIDSGAVQRPSNQTKAAAAGNGY